MAFFSKRTKVKILRDNSIGIVKGVFTEGSQKVFKGYIVQRIDGVIEHCLPDDIVLIIEHQ